LATAGADTGNSVGGIRNSKGYQGLISRGGAVAMQSGIQAVISQRKFPTRRRSSPN